MEEPETITIMDHLVQVGNAIVMKYDGMKPMPYFPKYFP